MQRINGYFVRYCGWTIIKGKRDSDFLRRKQRKALAEGFLESHVALLKKTINDKKSCNMLLFKFYPDRKKQHITEGAEKCVNNMPMLLKRHQIKDIKATVMQMSEVHFTKDNIKLKILFPVVIE